MRAYDTDASYSRYCMHDCFVYRIHSCMSCILAPIQPCNDVHVDVGDGAVDPRADVQDDVLPIPSNQSSVRQFTSFQLSLAFPCVALSSVAFFRDWPFCLSFLPSPLFLSLVPFVCVFHWASYQSYGTVVPSARTKVWWFMARV